ncbi:MAG: O-antigen ligase family protein [Solirubrobacteraceae bacterium]
MTARRGAAIALAAGVVALAFLTSSGADPSGAVTGAYAWSEIAVTVLGAGACAAAVWVGGRGRAWGAPAVALLAALTALAALSILWSIVPDWSWYGANQLLSYLAVFAGAAALARVAPEGWIAALGGVALATAAVSAWALLAKVFPATLASVNTAGRLQQPFGYSNAVGVAAAMGVPACLWAGGRLDGGRAVRALSIPALTLAVAALVLSGSRSSVLAAVIGVALLALLAAPVRLRMALIGAVGGAGAIPLIVWVLRDHALNGDYVLPAAQDAAGHTFGIVLVVVVALVVAAGGATAIAMERVTLADRARMLVERALLGLIALIPVLVVAALAASHRGLTGEVSHVWDTLTSTHAGATDSSGRLTQFGSSRPLYWHQGLEVGSHSLLAGAGELGYGIARLAYTTNPAKSDQAHSYLVQTFADLGLIGLALTLALLAYWVRAALRPLALRLPWSDRASVARRGERLGLVTMAAVTVTFGVQSALDWTWYFAGVAVPALVCAGWLAGRGPLLSPVGRMARRGRLVDRPGAGALITLIAAAALACAWVMWEPLHSAQAYDAAVAANTNAAALSDARTAASSNPLSVRPLFLLAALYQGLHDNPSAGAQLRSATRLQPRNPEPWLYLGQFYLQTGRPAVAVPALGRVLALDHTPDGWTSAASAAITQAQSQIKAHAA